ncbi:hypothetical protein HU200_038504 [Digitaria exilis]|uniref:Protein kinase domain-containing protein n=1 Tax=Digitaria exilis TaxID=1010633 RepID=A0A835BK86_9POAL|nr:hypothetical protein HU200_038504 [Digitaria exilis]
MSPSVAKPRLGLSVRASATTLNNITDGDALLEFRSSLRNPWGAIASWNKTTEFCSWHGVSCSLKHKNRVIKLNLSSEGLAGTITACIGNLTFLRTLDLSWNNLHVEIPSAIGHLSRLRYLNLSNNSFHGEINGNLNNCTSLEMINFDSNMLTGEIPALLGGLSRLNAIYLQRNNFNGIIPPSLANLSALQEVYFAFNKLEGPIPKGLGRLNSLAYVQLAANQISGMNHFTGTLPVSLANATKIYALDIYLNNFTGSVPPEIGKLCPALLSFDTNQHTATTAQDIFNLQDNSLGGMLPSSITNLSAQLQNLYVGNNEISGAIPSGISNLAGLTRLQFTNNRFTDGNHLTGLLPSSIGNLTQLLHLLTDNKFEGPLPTSLRNLQQLTAALFANNKFTGPLTMEIFNLSSLSFYLDLSNNYFVGPLPPESLVDLRLDSNSFNGSIPASISKMKGLTILTLFENMLSGEIPPELGLMNGLKILSLSHNNLSGHIPESFENMTSLDMLDISFNHLNGGVPLSGVFSNVTEFLLDGNLGLCGGIPQLHLPPCLPNSMQQNRWKLHHILKVTLPIVGILLCFSLVLIFISLKRKQKSPSTALAGSHLIDDKYPRVSYAELVHGTNGFDTSNLIGRGRYGSVYKCNLCLNNTMTTVAVKVFDLQQSGSSKSFISECEALSKIRHRNLINIITCCSISDLNQDDFKALVFGFMPNGSLHRWLHHDVQSSEQWHGLTLTERLNIAVDVADALDYLHNDCEPPIVHCDLKSSNILLNQEMVALVGDFGIARILPNSTSEQLIDSKSTIAIRGTIGYVAPVIFVFTVEYGDGGQVSTCGIILELFTGLSPTNDMFRDGLTLQKHAENAFPGMLMRIVNPILLTVEEASHGNNLHAGRNATEHISMVMLSITKLALRGAGGAGS